MEKFLDSIVRENEEIGIGQDQLIKLVLILADKRLVTKSYGKTFLRSLQSKTVRVCTVNEIVSALEMMVGR